MSFTTAMTSIMELFFQTMTDLTAAARAARGQRAERGAARGKVKEARETK